MQACPHSADLTLETSRVHSHCDSVLYRCFECCNLNTVLHQFNHSVRLMNNHGACSKSAECLDQVFVGNRASGALCKTHWEENLARRTAHNQRRFARKPKNQVLIHKLLENPVFIAKTPEGKRFLKIYDEHPERIFFVDTEFGRVTDKYGNSTSLSYMKQVAVVRADGTVTFSLISSVATVRTPSISVAEKEHVTMSLNKLITKETVLVEWSSLYCDTLYIAKYTDPAKMPITNQTVRMLMLWRQMLPRACYALDHVLSAAIPDSRWVFQNFNAEPDA